MQMCGACRELADGGSSLCRRSSRTRDSGSYPCQHNRDLSDRLPFLHSPKLRWTLKNSLASRVDRGEFRREGVFTLSPTYEADARALARKLGLPEKRARRHMFRT
jgi:hypothetical protein